MKLQYLGTAAAEGIPAMFCECDVCKKSRAAGGRNIRTRSQALVDDCLLIDFPADTYLHFLQHNVPLTTIKNCIITHSHSDHLYADELENIKPGFSHIYKDDSPISFYSDEASYNLMTETKKKCNISDDNLLLFRIPLYEPFDAGGYSVTALRAAHDPSSTPVIYLIERDGKTLFYSNDTSEYPEEGMEYLSKIEKPIDLISFDCTEACNDTAYIGHLSLDRCIRLRNTLKEIGAADDHTIFVLNHFSHNGKNVMYDDFVKIAAEYDFRVSYDGMVIEF